MTKKYRVTYTLHTQLGKHTRTETLNYFEALLQVLRNLDNHCEVENINIEVIEWIFTSY